MPQTHDIGNSFIHFQWHPKGLKPVTVSKTHEVEEPFRLARSLAVRLFPLRWAVVVGRWQPDTAIWDEEDPEIDVRLTEVLGSSKLGDIETVKSWDAAAS